MSGADAYRRPGRGVHNRYALTVLSDVGTVAAGSALAFSSGPLAIDGGGAFAINGNSLSFADLSARSGQIVNGGAAAATLTVEIGPGQTDVYGATLADGGTAPLGLSVPNGGALELQAANTLSGATNVAGTLDLLNALRCKIARSSPPPQPTWSSTHRSPARHLRWAV